MLGRGCRRHIHPVPDRDRVALSLEELTVHPADRSAESQIGTQMSFLCTLAVVVVIYYEYLCYVAAAIARCRLVIVVISGPCVPTDPNRPCRRARRRKHLKLDHDTCHYDDTLFSEMESGKISTVGMM